MRKITIVSVLTLLVAGAFSLTSFALAQSVSTTASTTATTTTTTSTTTSTTPLAVVCTGTASGSAITWNVSASGGTPPYTFIWSGDSTIAGSTTTPATSNETATGTYNASIQATDAASNTATGNCSAVISSLTTPISTSTTSSTQTAALQIVNNVDNATPVEGATVNYTITVSALGPAMSPGVTVADVLPSGLTFVSATATQGSYASSTGVWAVGDLAAGSNASLAITATVNTGTAGQQITNMATVSESAPAANTSTTTSANASITVAQPVSSGGTSTSTPASTTVPLIVSCDWGMNANNVVTWMASASGGTPPYSYAWSGDQVNGATGNSVTATYSTPGTYSATVRVTDAASNSATAPCSVSITTATTPVTTSTPATSTVAIPPTLSIGAQGAFVARGMAVTSIASGSFQAQIWGITYTVNWTNSQPLLTVGDTIGVSGSITSSTPLTVNATVVRDYNTSTVNTVANALNSFRTELNDLITQFQNLEKLVRGM